MNKIFSLNCIEERISNLKLILPSIIAQADKIYVNFIGCTSKDSCINNNFESNPKIETNFFYTGGSELRFFNYSNYTNAYYFTIDDDIIYPLDYSDKLIELHKKYNHNIISCVHGSDINLNLSKNYYQHRPIVHSFHKYLREEKAVMLSGVGTSCFHTQDFSIDIEAFQTSNMSDVYIGSFAFQQQIPIVAIKREDNWLVPIYTTGRHIWGNNPYKEIDSIINTVFKEDNNDIN